MTRKRRKPATKQRTFREVINVQFLRLPDGYYWFEIPAGFDTDGPDRDIMLRKLWNAGEVNGPFPSAPAAQSNSQVTLLGKDCEVTDMGQFPSGGGLH